METILKQTVQITELILDPKIKPFQVDSNVRREIIRGFSNEKILELIEKYSIKVGNSYFYSKGEAPPVNENHYSAVSSFYYQNQEQFLQDFPVPENLPATPFPFPAKDYDPKKLVVNNIPDGIRHQNYLSYLELCWDNHYPIVLRPDYFHHIILCEVAAHIKKNAEKFRSLFTTSAEKKELAVHSFDPYILPLHSMVDQLKINIPSDISSLLPEFSTTTESSRFAFAAAFCDAMSPYYSYSMFCCGIPKARIEGTVEDWTKIIESLRSVADMLQLQDYLYKVEKAINNVRQAIVRNEPSHIAGIFSLVSCGSGSQVEVDGWITDIFIEYPRVGYVGNFPSGIANVEYKNHNTGKNYIMKSGLLRSKFDGEFLVPDFTFVVYEK